MFLFGDEGIMTIGYDADAGIDEVVQAFIEDDFERQKGLARARQAPGAAIFTTTSEPILEGG